MAKTSDQLTIIDSTLFKLVDIDEYEEVNHLVNMCDISVDGDQSFTFGDGIVSHNSASGMGLSVRNPQYHGFYSLRGKVLNTYEMSVVDILQNKELSELTTVIGLDIGSDSIYDDPEELYEITIEESNYIVGKNDIIYHKDEAIHVQDLLEKEYA